jgi:hypothetical protein
MMMVSQAMTLAYRLIRFGKERDPAREGDYTTLVCSQLPVDIRFPVFGPIEMVLRGEIPKLVGVNFVEKSNYRKPNYSVWAAGIQASAPNDGLGELIQNLFSPYFVEFYEEYRQWIFDAAGRPDFWPEVWRFGRVVRNAISHGGEVKIDRPDEKPVTWYGLTYSASDNGSVILGRIIGLGDMVALMVDMSDELDRMGCPVLAPSGPRHNREYFG